MSDFSDLPLDRFQVNFATIGGDFGGKGSPMEIPVCYYLALKSERPVKMVMTREEVFRATGPTSGSSSPGARLASSR